MPPFGILPFAFIVLFGDNIRQRHPRNNNRKSKDTQAIKLPPKQTQLHNKNL